jgi:hypothetical protein
MTDLCRVRWRRDGYRSVCAAALCLFVFLFGGLSARPVAAAVISLCPAAQADAPPSAAIRYTDLAGAIRVLSVSDLPPRVPDCVVAALPVAATDVAWTALARGDPATTTLALSGVLDAGNFAPQSIENAGGNGAPASEARTAAPLALDLLSSISARPFGLEERARVAARADELTLQCAPGTRPAGVVVRTPDWRLPEINAIALRIDADGHGSFAVALDRAKGADPLSLGALEASAAPAARDFALPEASPQDDIPLAWTISCPAEAASLVIRRLTLAAPARERALDRAAWVWPADRWRDHGDDLLAAALRLGIKRVSISVPVADHDVVAPLALARFVAAARRHGVAVWAVDGDPRAVLIPERASFAARAAIYTRYNAHAAPEERLAGLEYDIEPYLEPGYALDPTAWQKAYVATIRQLRAATPMAIETVLPFWLATDAGARQALLDPLAGIVNGITVMDYRTDPIAVASFAEPFLAWGQKTGTPVHIALENGPIPDETIRYYRRAPAGILWLMPLGDSAAVVLLRQPAANPSGPSFAPDHDVTLPGSRISFLGDAPRLIALASQLDDAFRAWSSFAGLSFNGLL